MKEWLKLVLNYRSYPKNKTGSVFLDHPVGSHSVTCHPTQENSPRLISSHIGRYSIYFPREGSRLSWPWSWLHSPRRFICTQTFTHPSSNHLIATQPRVTPATFWSQVHALSVIPRLHDRANIKQVWWNPGLWLKCRPRLSPQLITCYIGLPITTRPLS